MRSRVLTAALCVLLTGAVHSNNPLTENRDIGDSLAVTVQTGNNPDIGCYLVTPKDEVIEFRPTANSDHRFVLRDGDSTTHCDVEITKLSKNDEGLWKIYYTEHGKTKGETYYQLTINSDKEEQIEKEHIEEDDNITWLTTYTHITAMGMSLDIALSKQSYDEDCTIAVPGSESKILKDLDLTGVTVHGSSYFVACRITVGPMTQELIGNWTICGIHTENGGKYKRCQQVSVEWLNANNPSSDWITWPQPKQDHVVNLSDTLSFEVRSFMPAIICHIVTPDGEDLVLTPDSGYPGLVLNSDLYLCNVTISQINKFFVGEWELHGLFRSFLVEQQARPISLHLYEEEESKEIEQSEEENSEEDDVTWLTTYRHITSLGGSLDIALSKQSYDEDCTIDVPGSETKVLKDLDLTGVTVHGSSHFVACRITVGPMTQELIGNWTICGIHTENGAKHKRCQQVSVEWNNPNQPSSGWNTWPESKFYHVVNFNGTLSPGLRGISPVLTCHVVTPYEEDLVLTPDSGYPGLTLNTASHICSVTMNPINKFFLGEWVLYGIFRGFITEANSRPMNLRLYDEENPYDQAYNVTVLDKLTRVINLGINLDLEVPANGNIDICEVISPAGQSYILNGAKGTDPVSFADTGCRVSIGPVTDGMVGEWRMIGKFNERDIFTERRQTLNIIKEDPENPIVDEDRIVVENTAQFINTTMNSSYIIIISTRWANTFESCHLRTPSGRQYTIMEGFHIDGIEARVDVSDDIACEVTVTVQSEDMLGDWVLIAKEIRNREPNEIRQPFTIYIEERVEAQPHEVMIIEGNDLYVRLQDSIDKYSSCKLFEPTGKERVGYTLDTAHNNTCGFIVRDVNKSDTGEWEIRYGYGITYRAFIDVVVNAAWETEDNTLTWIQGRSVDITIGPEDAIYCKVEDSQMRVVFEGFGRCHLVVDRATIEHSGVWKMVVGFQGKVVTEEFTFNVHVRSSGNKPVVTTHVAKEEPVVTLSCSVPIEYEVRSCSFREPSGRVMMASQGVGEDRYTFHGAGTSFESEIQIHECGLRISNPLTTDLGIWRCAVATDKEVYYGFLTVLYPYAISVPETAAIVVSEPTLAMRGNVDTVVEGDGVTMTCSIQSAIRYCYFRARNGTIYNVSPAESTDHVEYIGAGLDAGECGIQFRSMVSADSGQWSCHVGLPDFNQPEQRVDFQLEVKKPIEVQQEVHNDVLIVRGQVYNGAALEYCRYVRMDGFGFTSATLPSRYATQENLSGGLCVLNVQSPTVLDMHPWTIAAKMVDRYVEVAGTSDHTIEISTESQPEPEPTPTPAPVPQPAPRRNSYIYTWIMVITLGILLMSVGILLIPPKTRHRTIAKASSWRNSIRRSFTKKPLPSLPDNGQSTA